MYGRTVPLIEQQKENVLYFHLPSGASEAAALGTDCADPREEVTADIKHEETLSSVRSVGHA